jgi:hypothetical protein
MSPEFVFKAKTTRFFIIRFFKSVENIVKNIKLVPLVSRHEIYSSAAATLCVSHSRQRKMKRRVVSLKRINGGVDRARESVNFK